MLNNCIATLQYSTKINCTTWCNIGVILQQVGWADLCQLNVWSALFNLSSDVDVLAS